MKIPDCTGTDPKKIQVSGISMEWNPERGTCTFDNLPVAMMWVDTTLAGLMSGVQAMVGTQRFALALQSEGRKSVESDWEVISRFPDFHEGFKAIAKIAAVAGWGEWVLTSFDDDRKECRFRVTDNWEGRYQRALGVCWGSGMLAGKLAGYCSKLFKTNCWADQTAFFAKGCAYDEFVVRPSPRSIEHEIEKLLATDEATRADMAVALGKLEKEIAERRRMEEALRESEGRYRTLSEATFEGVAFTERGILIDANVQLAEMLGYEVHEMIGRPAAEFVYPEDLTLVQRNMNMGSELPYENRLVRKDGSILSVETRGGQFSNHGRDIRVTAIHNITVRKRATEVAMRAKEDWERTFDAVPDLIAILDTDYRIIRVNRAMAAKLGVTPEVCVGLRCYDTVHGTNGPPSFCPYRPLLADGNEHTSEVYEDRLGGEFMVRVSPLFDPGANLIGCVHVAHDLSERKAAEKERENLEAQVRQTQKMEAIGTLAGGIAHDFNNILSAISGFTELSIRRTPEDSPLRPSLYQILKGATRATNLVKQILTFSRQGEQELRPVPMAPLIKEALKFLRASIPTTIAIRQNFTSSDESVVLVDPTRIHQVIMNLCANASYAMREGGGTLEVELSAMDLSECDCTSCSELIPGAYLCLRVSDTGCGMDEATVQRIFDPFFTTKPREEGTGMGLAVVYGIVKACGGAISVQSKPGEGSHFYLYFPKAVSTSPEFVTESYETPTGEGNILLVDDEDDLVELGQAMLETLGYSVLAKTSSLEALEVFRSQPDHFDLLVTDYTMPHMTGIDLAKEVRKIRTDIPIILCSGYSDFLEKVNVADFGIQELIPKPITWHAIAKAIKSVLSGIEAGNDDHRQ